MKNICFILILLSLASCVNKVSVATFPDIVSGFYTIQNGTSSPTCQIELTLNQNATGFEYHLVTDEKAIKGKAVKQRDMDSKEDYIILYGIPWDDYQGDISQENKEDIQEKKLELPTEISGTINGDTITIQNHGNAMNYYVKFSECGSRYIKLVKKPDRK